MATPQEMDVSAIEAGKELIGILSDPHATAAEIQTWWVANYKTCGYKRLGRLLVKEQASTPA